MSTGIPSPAGPRGAVRAGRQEPAQPAWGAKLASGNAGEETDVGCRVPRPGTHRCALSSIRHWLLLSLDIFDAGCHAHPGAPGHGRARGSRVDVDPRGSGVLHRILPVLSELHRVRWPAGLLSRRLPTPSLGYSDGSAGDALDRSDSGISSEMRYSSFSHFPRSTSLHRLLQKGRKGTSATEAYGTSTPQLGHFSLGMSIQLAMIPRHFASALPGLLSLAGVLFSAAGLALSAGLSALPPEDDSLSVLAAFLYPSLR